ALEHSIRVIRALHELHAAMGREASEKRVVDQVLDPDADRVVLDGFHIKLVNPFSFNHFALGGLDRIAAAREKRAKKQNAQSCVNASQGAPYHTSAPHRTPPPTERKVFAPCFLMTALACSWEAPAYGL